MSPLFDLYCQKCDTVEEDVWLKINEEIPLCIKCKKERNKICNCHSFKLRYDPKKDSCGWAFNSYDHSSYWDAVKKERAEGKNVKACNEN
jgi:hypothetical protein